LLEQKLLKLNAGENELKMRAVGFLVILACLGILLFLVGCAKGKVEELKKEELFIFPIGIEEEEIGVIRQTNGELTGPSTVLFKNGFFYVVDQVNNKLLKITTQGDVILVLAHGAEEYDKQEDLLRTKQRKYYPFAHIGQIAVDNENNIYIEEKVVEIMPEKEEIDLFISSDSYEEEGNERYVSRILKFDRLGNFLFSIGENGRGTVPFFYVYKIDVDIDGNLIVFMADEGWEQWTFCKYDNEGSLQEKKSIHIQDVFNVKDMEESAYFVMDVLPDSKSQYLIYWVSLYTTSYDTKELKKEEDLWGEEIEIKDADLLKEKEPRKEEKKTGRDLLYYKLLYYNLETSEIDRSFKWENELGGTVHSTEEFFGMDGESNSFLWEYVNATKAIISIFRSNGSLLTRRSFVFEEDGLWTNVQVAFDGSVCAVKIGERDLSFYRWRSDKLIHSKREKVTLKEFFLDKVQEFKNANR